MIYIIPIIIWGMICFMFGYFVRATEVFKKDLNPVKNDNKNTEDNSIAFNRNDPKVIEQGRGWAMERRDKEGYKFGHRKYNKQIKKRIHGHSFYIGEMVCIIKTHKDKEKRHCLSTPNHTYYQAENKEGLRFGIANCEL